MKAFETKIECLMDGGDTLTAVIDQRDHAAWEGSELFDTHAPGSVTKVRWLAWHALKRTGQLRKEHTWQEFNERLCVQAVVQLDESEPAEDGEGEQSDDPSRS